MCACINKSDRYGGGGGNVAQIEINLVRETRRKRPSCATKDGANLEANHVSRDSRGRKLKSVSYSIPYAPSLPPFPIQVN